MKKFSIKPLSFLGLLLLSLNACGLFDDVEGEYDNYDSYSFNSGSSYNYNSSGQSGKLQVRVSAPNGDPISGATVWRPGNGAKYIKQINSTQKFYYGDSKVSCSSPSTSSVDTACTDHQGFASLTCEGTGKAEVYVAKGSFTFTTTVTCGAPTHEASLPTNSAGNMAVVTGNYDRMEDVLAKLGFGQIDNYGNLIEGTELFKLYDGDGSLGSEYKNFSSALLDLKELMTNDIIFINCDEFNLGQELSGETDTKLDNLRRYVENGGKLYVTDLSYDYLEQIFPNQINFYGGGSGEFPETPGAAEEGYDHYDSNATVNDPDLQAWLDNIPVNDGDMDYCWNVEENAQIGALNNDGSVYIANLSSGWALMEGEEENATSPLKTWVAGTNLDEKNRPLTVTFDVGLNGGRVLYTSYHTADHCNTAGFWPQERILQYLVFEL